jgi:membrane protein implicated in regulation of membrane protease activity
MWSTRVLLKYWTIQLAGWVVVFAVAWLLAEHFEWPRRIVWAALALWMVKDAALYPFVWHAYDSRRSTRSPYPGEGVEGVALRRLNPRGMVRIGGELWSAEPADGIRRIEDGETVRVTGRDGMTLFVEPTRRGVRARARPAQLG